MNGHSVGRAEDTVPHSVESLEERLSRPTAGVVEALRQCPGDVAVLGAGGKMGATFARMARRAADELGDGRRVVAISRFSSPETAEMLRGAGVDVLPADLFDRHALAALPDVANVLYLVGQKFGTTTFPAGTWMANVIVPYLVADRYRGSRIVALSSGNVYPLVPVRGPASREQDAVAPVGEYAATCVGRERVFEHAASLGTRVAIVELNYAVDLRYGVLVDVALKVWRGEPVDVEMGYANVIWQGDACAQALQCLPLASAPPRVVNVTGGEALSIQSVALELGRLLGRTPRITGHEAADALLSDTSLARSLFGPPTISTDTLLAWVAEWIRAGQPLLGRSTHFEERHGRF
ncbi:MAG: hypothetical protein U0163_09745 [Gemmatimonadaceae bacterium]